MKYTNPEIPEGINVTDTHPLKEFAMLVGALVIIVVLITAVLAYSVDWLAEYVPYEYETGITQAFNTKTSERNLVDDYLQQLADDLVTRMDMPEGMKVTVHYVNQDVVNGMATLGGHIFIYRGLLEKLPHENALVMLLGHEIGHIKLRHPIKGLGKGLVISLFLAAALGQSSDTAASLLSGTSTLTMLSFSREQEERADQEGLIATHNYFKHTQGSADLFNVLLHAQDENGMYVPQIMSSHPDTKSRIQLMNQFVSEHNWLAKGWLKPVPDAITNKLMEDKNAGDKISID